MFTKELDRFLSGANTVWVEGRTSDDAVGGGPMDGGEQNGKKSFNYGNQQKLRNFENTRVILGHNVIKGDSAVTISNINGRPTREFIFKLTTANLALRVFKSDGGKRVVSWMNLNNSHMSNKSGPDVLKSESKHDKAQVANPRGKAHLEVSYPCDLGVSVHSNQSESVVGKSSRLPMESTVVSVVSEAPIPDQATELLTSTPPTRWFRIPIGKAKVSPRSIRERRWSHDNLGILKLWAQGRIRRCQRRKSSF